MSLEAAREAFAKLSPHFGCGSHGCAFDPPAGQGVNGPCKCHEQAGFKGRMALLYRAVRDALAATGEPAAPTVVTLCGSTRFKEAFIAAEAEEERAGRAVLTVHSFEKADGISLTPATKAMLDELHLRKIDMSDEILVINVDGYVGEGCLREIDYARATGKRVRFLEDRMRDPRREALQSEQEGSDDA